MDVHLDSFHDTVDILEEYNPSYLTINGLDAVSKEFDCTLEDVYEDITYFESLWIQAYRQSNSYFNHSLYYEIMIR